MTVTVNKNKLFFFLKQSAQGKKSDLKTASLKNSKRGRVSWPCFQMACLSCCSVLMERASGGSDVGGRLLSTPSRLLRHTGHVSCWEREEKMLYSVNHKISDTTAFSVWHKKPRKH